MVLSEPYGLRDSLSSDSTGSSVIARASVGEDVNACLCAFITRRSIANWGAGLMAKQPQDVMYAVSALFALEGGSKLRAWEICSLNETKKFSFPLNASTTLDILNEMYKRYFACQDFCLFSCIKPHNRRKFSGFRLGRSTHGGVHENNEKKHRCVERGHTYDAAVHNLTSQNTHTSSLTHRALHLLDPPSFTAETLEGLQSITIR